MRSAALACLTFLCLLVALPGLPAAAADSTLGGDLSAELISLPPWMGPTGVLTASFKVTNSGSSPLSGLSINVVGYDGPGSRSALESQIEGRNLTQEWSDTTSPPGAPLAPGETRTVQFDLANPLSAYRFFSTSRATDHAFPLRFTLTAGGSSVSIDTQLLYFQESRVDHPLQVALVIPLDAPTVFDAQDREVSSALETAIAPSGRIARILTALETPTHTAVPVALAPSGKLLASLITMQNGFVRSLAAGTQQVGPTDPAAQEAAGTLTRLRALAGRGGVAILASPYANAPLPGLIANGLAKDVDGQISGGRALIKEALGVDPLPGWMLPTGGLVDDPTVTQLVKLGVQDVVVSPDSLRSGAPPVLTPGAQARVSSRGGSIPALVQDGVLSSRLQDGIGLSPVQVRQRFYAECATILFEAPGRTRTAAVLAPPDWDPSAEVIGGILDALVPANGSPWMTGITPDAAITQVPFMPLVNLTQALPASEPDTPPRDYFDALRTASARVEDFATLSPPQPPPDFQNVLVGLTRAVLVAEGAEWWGRGATSDPGRALARAVADRVRNEFAKIQVREQTITLTSRQATIPLVLDSGVTYPVQVVIRLESDKLAFQRGRPCSLGPNSPATCLTLVLLPRAQTEQIRATAEFSGRFLVRVEVQTANSAVVAHGQLVIRSTAYNVLALGIIAGAALFIMVSWVMTAVRKHHRAAAHPAQQEAIPAGAAPSEGT